MLINWDYIKFQMGTFFFIFTSLLIAQETHNLEIIWQKASPESVFYFGRCIASGDVNGDSFSDIMIVGDSVINPSNPDSAYRGKCWIFYGEGVNFDTIPDIQLLNSELWIFRSLHSTDINGDGFSDVCCGATNNAGGLGAVLIFLGGNPMDSSCDYVLHSTQAGSCFGCAIASGDVNGDSYSDLIVGAYGAWPMPGGYDMGRVYIYYGGPNFDTIPDIILNGGHENDRESFGVSVSGTGDVNGDGYKDIIIGAYNYGPNIAGRIYIYYGGDPMDTIYDVAMTGEGTWHTLGEFGVDFINNFQTFDQAITSTPIWGPTNPQGYNPGKVYVLFGGNPMDSIPDVWMIGRTDASTLGMSISSAGDLTNNFYDEIIAGAPVEYNSKGTSYVWLCGAILDTIPDAWIKGTQYIVSIGDAVASAGDVNSDGKDEILVCNSSSMYPAKVWVCKYTGQGIEEGQTQNAEHLTLEISPNPVRTVMRIRCPWSVKEIRIYDITGKIVKVLDVGKSLESGLHEMELDLRSSSQKRVATGVYFIEVSAKQEKETIKEIKKIIVAK